MDTGGIPGGALRAGLVAPLAVPEPATQPPPGAAFVRTPPASFVRSDAVRARELLATGDIQRMSGRTVGSNDAKHGVQQLYRVADVSTNESHLAIVKSLGQGGAQEAFAHEVAVAMGIDDLFPNVAWRDGAGAAIELFEGRAAGDYRISGAGDLFDAFIAMTRSRHPELDEGGVFRRAMVDRQLVHAFDAILANGDRHAQNILVNRTTNELRMIDHGLINRYDAGADGLKPTLRAAYAMGEPTGGGTRAITLLPEVQEHLAHIDHESIRTAFDRMMARIDGSVRIGQETRPMTQQFLDDVLGRLATYARTGIIHARSI